MRKILTTGFCLALSLAYIVILPSPVEADDAAGKALFLKYNCNSCHEVAAQHITVSGEPEEGTPPDLSTIGDEVKDPEWLKKYLKKREKKEGTKHKKRFKGNKEELAVLVDWLLSLRAN